MTLVVNPAKVEADIAATEAELAAAYAEHAEKADAADEVWRQVLSLEQRIRLLRQRLADAKEGT